MRLDNRMLEDEFATALASWHTVRLRPVAKKGGDATLPGAYRGIGIQSAVARLLAMLVLRRLAPAVEQANLLGRGQSGFRSFEEAVAQVATLLEICGRRRESGSATYLLFIDFAAAYDSVPHDVLLRKLDLLGVRGQLHRLIRRCLEFNHAQAMVGTTTGERFRVRRGLVQGCPLSPLLFNLFINDLFSDSAGVRVPGLPDGRVADLKYADDVVALARSRNGLRRQLRRVSRWGEANGMRVGARKCGIMVVGESEEDTEERHARLLEEADTWRVGDNAWAGESPLIPIVSTYRYLGIVVNQQLDYAAMARARAEAARKVFGMMQHTLRDRRLPIYERITLAKAFVVPVAFFGAELWAGRVVETRPLELLLNDLWTTVLRVPRHVSLYCVRRSVRCCKARTASLIASARAFAKWRSSRTWIGDLLRARPFEGMTVWSRRVSSALTRIDLTRGVVNAARAGNVALAKRLTAAAGLAAECARSADGTLHGAAWRRYQLDATVAEGRKLALSGVRDLSTWAVWQMTRMRVGAFSTYQRLAQQEVAEAQWKVRCPFCDERTPEDLAHFLLECPAWSQQRGRFLFPILRRCKVIGWLGKRERRADLAHILIGGCVGSRRALSLAHASKDDKKQQRGGHHGPAAAVAAAPAALAPAPAAAAAAAAPAPAVPAVAAAAAARAAEVADNNIPPVPAPVPAPVPVPVPPPPVPIVNEGKAVDGDDAAVDQVVPVADDVLGHVAAERARLQRQSALLRSSGLNWMVGVGRYLQSVWRERTERGPPLSQRRHRGMAELDAAPGGGPRG
jgi:hypothetical protein